MKTAVIGMGGIGKAAASIMGMKSRFSVVGLVDRNVLAADPAGLDVQEAIAALNRGEPWTSTYREGKKSEDPLAELFEVVPDVEGLILTVPSIPHDLVSKQVRRILSLGYRGAMVDVLDQSTALDILFPLESDIREAKITHISGCGCTPGLLTTGAALMAHSFTQIEDVRIHFGVGVADYLDNDEASLREVLAGWNDLGVSRAESLTHDEIRRILDEQDGILDVEGLKHGDDVLLHRSGVVSRDRVRVGGRVDTRHDEKPVSTTVRVTGRTYEGHRSEHVMKLGDETSMFANTAGPAVGYLARAVDFHRRGLCGLFGATDLMPLYVQ